MIENIKDILENIFLMQINDFCVNKNYPKTICKVKNLERVNRPLLTELTVLDATNK